MESFRELRQLLTTLPAAPITDENLLGRIEKLLAANWANLKGSQEHAMAAWKLGRMETVNWHPPLLGFTIERDDAARLGGTRAELQRWQVDFDAMGPDGEVEGQRGDLLDLLDTYE